MDSATEKRCLEQLSTLILDANEKVSLKTISNEYLISNKVAQEVLLKWLDQNEKKSKNLEKNFLVQGKDSKGMFRISVVPEETKAVLEKKWKTFSSMLYSVDTKPMQNTRKLELPDYEPIKVITILLSPREQRDISVPEIPVVVKKEPAASVKSEPVKTKTFFSMAKPTAKVVEKPAEKKEEKPKVKEVSPEVKASKVEEPSKEVKNEKQSPSESKPASKAPTNKKTQLKNQKPAQKNSITSFFSNKPSTSTASTKKTPPPVKTEEVLSEDEPMVVESLPKKRSTPEPVAQSKQQSKKKPAVNKLKLKVNPNNKRSRIRVIEDSSDEDVEEQLGETDEPEAKLIKFDRDSSSEREATPKPSSKKEPEVGKSRKAKRWITKHYEDEDGFIKTEKIQEEYSASEEENDENRKKNSPPKVKVVEKTKKASPVKAKTAQNNKITSFFTKK